MTTKAQFHAILTELHPMLQWIRKGLESAHFDKSVLHKIELASEEALVNIIRHAYKDGSGMIEIRVHAKDGFAEITIRDQGPPFNPLGHDTSFDLSAGIEERKVGGLGILFMREYMDEVCYQRDGNANILTLIKTTGSFPST